MTGYFLQAFIYLIAAVIAVPIAKRLGLGSVLGYLIAGVVIGQLQALWVKRPLRFSTLLSLVW
ncbi:glutathione-regulated potassium-efflux system protein kefC [Vibrio ishigakensis]|uniref:Glutathione-regulated potassium-efflux system protein kefC n=1 Tax=Vibrio ishigakensis TaxID=1481914 RepID=A0A0B8PA32_9VIBR|nr:glutathione-regulated potassium-efflux system protein kefC [Vibrio ishigakensis]